MILKQKKEETVCIWPIMVTAHILVVGQESTSVLGLACESEHRM